MFPQVEQTLMHILPALRFQILPHCLPRLLPILSQTCRFLVLLPLNMDDLKLARIQS